MPANYVLLERIELNASAASVTFANIPQTGYTDLKVVMSVRNTGDFNTVGLVLNGVSTNQTARRVIGSGSSAASSTYTEVQDNPSSSTANTFSNGELYIPNYTSSTNKSMSFDIVSENNATLAYATLEAWLWSQTAAITSVGFTGLYGGSIAANSTFSLYGLAATGTTPAIAPKASGGNITTDGTYWIHTFNASGTFIPQTGLSCDYLVVAGGGGGGEEEGGGGGAGGYLTSIGGSTISLSSNTSYTVSVGAGGIGGDGQLRGGNGTDSSLSGTGITTITSTGGGGAGSADGSQKNGATGGSGGGGSSDTGGSPGTGAAGNTPSTSPAQGFAGGNGFNRTSALSEGGGGGGGSSAVGATAIVNAAGNGGSGTANSISGSSVTYAGGGGGGQAGNGVAGTANGGGGAGSKTGIGTSGTANLGGGGGGGGGNAASNGGAGGSGIIIIRYLAA